MAPPTIVLFNHNGRVGSALLSALSKVHQSGKVNLVVLHRAGSNVSSLPDGVEKREVDLASPDITKLRKAVADAVVLISAAGSEALAHQNALVDALEGSNNLVTFIPSEFGESWSDEDRAIPSLSFLPVKEALLERARTKKVPVTVVHSGFFTEFLGFPGGLVGIAVPENKIVSYKDNLKKGFRITSLPYLGEGVAQLVSGDLNALPGQVFDLTEFNPTGNELIEVLTKVHGSETKVNPYSDAQYNEQIQAPLPHSLGARFIYNWAEGWEDHGKPVIVKGSNGQGLQAIINVKLMTEDDPTEMAAEKSARSPMLPPFSPSIFRRTLHTSKLPRNAHQPTQVPHASRSRASKWIRGTGGVLVVAGGVYAYDRQYNASALSRSLRTGWIGLLCTVDYKLNFSPEKAGQIDHLHERVAARLRWVIDENQGMYLKLGQALGLQAALLPKPYREAFGHVFDRAPSVPYDEVVGVFQKDLGLDPLDVFLTFSTESLASASIAQVHKATLPPLEPGGPERVVAVKVQKPAIEKQMEWDLFSYRSLMWLAERLFDMPMYFVAEYISSQMRLETSFTHEAGNARRCAELLALTPELRDDVYVPKVYGEKEGAKESQRIMAMEWVDGCRLNDKQQMEKWGLKPREVMDLAISTMSAMTFSWGFVHCDPHPGNLLVRPHPTKKGKPQLILIDHGLYITLPQKFREEYCTLWRSLFVLDVPTIEGIAKKWGIALDANMFASAILLRPFQVNKHKKDANGETVAPKTEYEQQLELKKRLRTMLENEKLIPRELIFLTRCQRMMQANNQTLGSPSSRVNLTAKWAAIGYTRSLTGSRSLHNVGLRTWLKDRFDIVLFRVTLGFVDLAFWATALKQRFLAKNKDIGWEDKLQHQFEAMAKEEFGIEIDDTVFLG